MTRAHMPLVGLTADFKAGEGKPFHSVGEKYLTAVADAARCVPIIIPALSHAHDARDLVRRLDGLVFTGNPSNVHPSHYDPDPDAEAEPHDEARDATSLPLIRAALEDGVPLFAICRGIQEVNVALGGALHAKVHEIDGRADHRAPKHDDLDVVYGPVHAVQLVAGGMLAGLLGTTEIEVNSLHEQALGRLAGRLAPEAVAPDGTIEAVRVTDARAFALAVQWHPEYKATENPVSMKLFTAFGDAARARAEARDR